jgi:predicted  nucleic acid-binding Zn-ribbon protein
MPLPCSYFCCVVCHRISKYRAFGICVALSVAIPKPIDLLSKTTTKQNNIPIMAHLPLFAVNDAVYVREDSRQLEGVVAWQGSARDLKFADGDAAEIWIGVRLTGASVGLGTNDGSVDGHEYFTSPPNCGVFVRAKTVSKRQLNRLEELRLKRELAAAAKKSDATAVALTSTAVKRTGSAASTPAASPAVSPKKPSIPPLETKSRSTTPEPSRAEGKPAVSKLEELRLRRAALKEKKEVVVKPPAPPVLTEKLSPAASTVVDAPTAGFVSVPAVSSPAPKLQNTEKNSGQNSNLHTSKQEVETIQKLLNDKQTQVDSLAIKLAATEQALHAAREKLHPEMAALQSKLASTEHELSQTKSELEQAKLARPQLVVSSNTGESDDRLASLQSALEEWKENASEATAQLKTMQGKWEIERQSRDTALQELSTVKTEVSVLRKELQAFNDRTDQRGASDTLHYKELAKLQSEISAQKRRVEALEKEKLESEATIEDLTLDKEQLLEEKESLEDRLDELRLDAETAQMEVEELKMELEDARQASSDGSKGTLDATTGGDAEEVVQALSTQNARLREALIRLREQTQFEKLEVARQLRDAEKEAENARGLVDEVQRLRALNTNLEEQVNDLKDMVEQGSAFEQMVEDLSDRLLSMEEDNIALRTVVREMEEAAELTAEMEEVQADELKALSRDLEGRDTIIHNLEEAIKM